MCIYVQYVCTHYTYVYGDTFPLCIGGEYVAFNAMSEYMMYAHRRERKVPVFGVVAVWLVS